MRWNWQQKQWPHFEYNGASLSELEAKYLQASGVFLGSYQHIDNEPKKLFIVESIGNEALKTSEIEGELLNRDSVQSSLRRHFGLSTDKRKSSPAERGIADMMIDLYDNFMDDLSHEALYRWHQMLTNGRFDLEHVGRYRGHEEPMQVVSGYADHFKIHFEAPPSNVLSQEMEQYVHWFNDTAPNGKTPLPALIRASIAHLYFVSIHPFEDGNGRIARALAIKTLSQHLEQPTLIALSVLIQKNRNDYYQALANNNKTLEINDWLMYFSKTILSAQDYTQQMMNFFIQKVKLYDRVVKHLNTRQIKALERMFREGLEGFKGGLSAKKYMSITDASPSGATRDLQELVELNALRKTGERKGTRYYLNV